MYRKVRTFLLQEARFQLIEVERSFELLCLCILIQKLLLRFGSFTYVLACGYVYFNERTFFDKERDLYRGAGF